MHRYIISEITTERILRLAYDYDLLIDKVSNTVKELEDKQLSLGIGMTISGEKVPEEMRNKPAEATLSLAEKKHGNKDLSNKLRGK